MVLLQYLSTLRYLQAPKKEKKETTEEDAAFKEKKKQEQAQLKEAREKGLSVDDMIMPSVY